MEGCWHNTLVSPENGMRVFCFYRCIVLTRHYSCLIGTKPHRFIWHCKHYNFTVTDLTNNAFALYCPYFISLLCLQTLKTLCFAWLNIKAMILILLEGPMLQRITASINKMNCPHIGFYKNLRSDVGNVFFAAQRGIKSRPRSPPMCVANSCWHPHEERFRLSTHESQKFIT